MNTGMNDGFLNARDLFITGKSLCTHQWDDVLPHRYGFTLANWRLSLPPETAGNNFNIGVDRRAGQRYAHVWTS